jgi:uncharacterized membrane protein YhaH (DUF805 family)
MNGNVIGFDPDTNTGAISGHDGNRYDFSTSDWHGQRPPRHGDVVDFQPQGQRATQIYGTEPQYIAPGFGEFYFSPSGRISRSQYWLKFVLPYAGITLILEIIIVISAVAGSVALAGIFYVLTTIFSLVAFWPSIAIMVKRIHDRNKTGWLVLLPLVPALLMLLFMGIGAAAGGGGTAVAIIGGIFGIALLAIAIWFFVEFGCMRGTIGANRFGPDPVQ